MRESYRGYLITLDPPPIPSRMADFQFYAYDYDGPGDPRCGFAETLEAAKDQIDEIELMLLDDDLEDDSGDLDDLEFDDLDYIDDGESDDGYLSPEELRLRRQRRAAVDDAAVDQ